ncbi:MAG: cobalamin biosynthesis protein CbiX [Roseateles sp.]|nr:MAG: cobalamin biosynthesis protein CbiX [Roseateles sp.]
MDGLLLFAHGARDPAWARPFEAVAARLREARPGVPLALAFLEFMAPDLPTAGDQLVAAGCTRVHILPLFLGTGGHVRRDVPALLQTLEQRHGDTVTWELHPPLGEHDSVLAAIAGACAAVLP